VYEMLLDILLLLPVNNQASSGSINVHPIHCHEGPEEE